MNFFFRSAIIRYFKLVTLVIPIICMLFFTTGGKAAHPDTTWSVSFNVNMTKAINQHVFNADSDYVYIVMDHGIEPMRLVPGPGNIYSGLLFDILDSGVTYHYKFRINNALNESVNRQLTAKPGTVTVNAWWNNEPLNLVTYVVNMEFEAQKGAFNPVADSVFLIDTLTSPATHALMSRNGTSFNYSWIDTLVMPGTVRHYKYRVNSNPGTTELANKPERLVRIPDTILTVSSDFDNYNPGKRQMTFQCDMGYYVKAQHFSPSSDYLIVSGNFNGSGGNDVLFDTDGDTVYNLDIFIDTAWIHQGPLSFKFLIKGAAGITELPGKPSRSYAFHDTTNQNPNIFSCFFNDLNPSVPTPPWVYNVNIQGLLIYKKVLSGIYSYENVNGIAEGISTYRWLRSNNSSGTNAAAIDSATRITYVVDTLDIGKWLVFEVTPHGVKGDSAVGEPVRVVTSNSISAWDVGMGENSLISRVYPNPASNYITVEARDDMDRIELINFLNQTDLIKANIGSGSETINVSNLPRGIYFLKATTKSQHWGIVRIVRM